MTAAASAGAAAASWRPRSSLAEFVVDAQLHAAEITRFRDKAVLPPVAEDGYGPVLDHPGRRRAR